jgi:hypothetical protein
MSDGTIALVFINQTGKPDGSGAKAITIKRNNSAETHHVSQRLGRLSFQVPAGATLHLSCTADGDMVVSLPEQGAPAQDADLAQAICWNVVPGLDVDLVVSAPMIVGLAGAR